MRIPFGQHVWLREPLVAAAPDGGWTLLPRGTLGTFFRRTTPATLELVIRGRCITVPAAAVGARDLRRLSRAEIRDARRARPTCRPGLNRGHRRLRTHDADGQPT